MLSFGPKVGFKCLDTSEPAEPCALVLQDVQNVEVDFWSERDRVMVAILPPFFHGHEELRRAARGFVGVTG